MVHKVISKHIARLAAVQFAYQLEITKENYSDSVERFLSSDIFKEGEYKEIKTGFFKRLVSQLNDETLTVKIEKVLKLGKNLIHLSIIELCILKIALIEMIYEKTDIPVIINEYVEIAKVFLDHNSIKFINALLDSLSKNVERKCLIKI